jgi:hypothetical protein
VKPGKQRINGDFMGYMSFHEYVEKNGGKKPKVAVVADYEGSADAAPSLGKMPDNAGGVGQSGKVNPYKAGKDAPDPNKGKLADGLGSHGDKKLQSHAGEVGKPTKELGSYPGLKTGIKTSEWVQKNKGLSLAEFTKKIRESRLEGVKSPSKAYEAIKETFSVCKKNPSYIADVVLEMRRNGLFEAFFASMSQQPESFNIIAKLMEADNSYARKLSMAISEMVGPPLPGHDDMGGDEMGGEDMGMEMPKPKKKRHHHHDHDMDHDADHDMDHDDDHEDMDDSEDEDMGDEDEMGDHEDDEHGELSDMEGGKDQGMPMVKGKGKEGLMKAMKHMGYMNRR